ncbi:MAG: DsrE family protein [Thermoplasmata archaeon]
MANSILVLITKPPYGLEEAFAGLRLALAFAVNGMKTTVLFIGDGVYNVVKDQKSDAIRMPSNIDATKDLFDFDAATFVIREDIAARGISDNRLFEGPKVIDASEVKKLIMEHDVVTTF